MIVLKTDEEIENMKEGGKMLHNALQEAKAYTKVGVSTQDIDNTVEKSIRTQGGEPGFKRVHGYEWATCVCVNSQIVHTPPSDKIIEDGDVVTIDAGVFFKGLHTDSAITVQVGTKDKKTTHFLETGKQALKKALKFAQNGNHIGHISKVFQDSIEGEGYSIIRELTGHGVGKELHEDPYVPCFLDKPVEKTLPIEPGMTLAIEVMYAMGNNRTITEKDGWSIKMADNSIAACFEHSIAVKEKSTLILT